MQGGSRASSANNANRAMAGSATVVRLDAAEHRATAGRPRDPRVDEVILEATRELLVTLGYRRLAVDAVARRAGVSRTTVRLRWKSKAELVFDAVSPDPRILQVPDTGSLEGDIRGCVDNTVRLFRSAPMRAAFQGLLDDARNHPDVGSALSERIYRPSIEGFAQLIARAVARGEIRQHVEADVLFDVIAGSSLYRLTVSGGDPARLADQLVAILTAGLAGTAPGASDLARPAASSARGGTTGGPPGPPSSGASRPRRGSQAVRDGHPTQIPVGSTTTKER
ncbi:MAG: TetR/AcrR family transcriptional regulator [Acidimicrobiales bacterium]|jgi:AcrR family transcriptional regulator